MTKKLVLSLLLLIPLLFSLVSSSPAYSAKLIENNLTVIENNSQGILLSVSARDYRIDKSEYQGQIFDRIEVPNTNQSSEINMPSLPVFSRMIGIPTDSDVSFIILDDQNEVLVGPYNLKYNVLGGGDFENNGETFGSINQGLLVEQDLKIYPEMPVRLMDEGWLRDQKIVRLEVFPFQYDSESSSLTWHHDLKIKISFTKKPGVKIQKEVNQISDSYYEDIYKKFLVNYDLAKGWRGFPVEATEISTTLSTSDRLKISVGTDGLYRISNDDLASFGLVGLDPDKFRITSQGNEIAFFIENDNGDQFFGYK